MAYPTAIPSYGLIAKIGDQADLVARDVEQICTKSGIVPATASVYVTAITTAMSTGTAGASTQPKLYVSAGTVRVINSVTATSGTCAVRIMTTGATHGQEFELIRSVTTGACAIDVRSGSTALKTYVASKKFGARLRFIGAAWVLVSDWTEA